jgi:Bacterial regulatory proteins, tetR family.
MPKIVNHEQYRKELLGKCFNLFAEKGYAAITMRQISAGLKSFHWRTLSLFSQ